MNAIKLHLDEEEYAPVCALAKELNVKPEDIAYAALNRVMLNLSDPLLRSEIVHTRLWRKDNLPRWGDPARAVHAYESKTDEHCERLS